METDTEEKNDNAEKLASAPVKASPPIDPSSEVKTPTTPLTLDFAAVSDARELTTWAEFRDGFELELRYVARSELQKLSKRCTTNRFDPKTHQRVSELDPDKFSPEFVKKAVKNWRGLTPNKLASMIRINMDAIPLDRRDDEITFSSAQMTFLLKNCYDLDTFLNSVVTDLTWFQPEDHEESVGN